MKENGSGLLYRGPFVFRKGTGSSSLTLESAAFGGGRLTPRGAMFYVTDYLGSVRAVVDGTSGAVYEASDYSYCIYCANRMIFRDEVANAWRKKKIIVLSIRFI